MEKGKDHIIELFLHVKKSFLQFLNPLGRAGELLSVSVSQLD